MQSDDLHGSFCCLWPLMGLKWSLVTGESAGRAWLRRCRPHHHLPSGKRACRRTALLFSGKPLRYLDDLGNGLAAATLYSKFISNHLLYTLAVSQSDLINRLSSWDSKAWEALTILGGTHLTMRPYDTLATSWITNRFPDNTAKYHLPDSASSAATLPSQEWIAESKP